jgi:anthranilate phosphoribosyltransferase
LKIPMNKFLNLLVNRKDLSRLESKELLGYLTEKNTSPLETVALLSALATKGETINEISGFIDGMKEKMFVVDSPEGAIDIVGSGGDGSGSINISTISALVTASCGVKVAKHGNRAASSLCGSADVLEALGVKIDLTPRKAEKVLKKVGMVFLFAPGFHPVMKQVGPVRKELGIRTIFNYLGPFLNPGNVKRMLLGAANLPLALMFLKIAKNLDYEHILIVASRDGLDEISVCEKTDAFEVKKGRVRKIIIDPLKLGFPKYKKSDLAGGDAKLNSQIARGILSGEYHGAKRDSVLINSAYALLISGKTKNVKQGLGVAEEALRSGKALNLLEELIKETNNE